MKWGRRTVKALSSAAFDIYIIHCHILIFDRILKDRFVWIADLPAPAILVITVVCACVIYLVLALPGMIRIFLFEKTRLNRMMQAGAKKIDGRIYPE